MVYDILLQVVVFLVMIFMYLYMHNIPQNLLKKFRYRDRAHLRAKHHFVRGAQLLSQARSPSNSRSDTISLAKQAEEEADKAISLNPADAAAHILKALTLELQGFKTSALDSLDVALSPLAVKSLTDKEKGDALFKRADLGMALAGGGGGKHQSGRVDLAIEDLTQAVKLCEEKAKALCLLGECYELKKMKEEAKSAYEEALKAQPELVSAQKALDRLGSEQ